MAFIQNTENEITWEGSNEALSFKLGQIMAQGGKVTKGYEMDQFDIYSASTGEIIGTAQFE